MSSASGKTIAAFILLSFIATAFLSPTLMTYGPDGDMRGGCPFSTMGASLCPPSSLPGAIHHLSAYQSFMSAPLNLITVLLILVSAVFIFLFQPLLYRPLVPISYRSPPFTSHNRKMRRWLSLFEYSRFRR